jgi:hypothetical protein
VSVSNYLSLDGHNQYESRPYMKLTQNQIRKNAIIASASEIETKSND